MRVGVVRSRGSNPKLRGHFPVRRQHSDADLVRGLVTAIKAQAHLLPPGKLAALPTDAELAAHVEKNLNSIKALLLQGLQRVTEKPLPQPASGKGSGEEEATSPAGRPEKPAENPLADALREALQQALSSDDQSEGPAPTGQNRTGAKSGKASEGAEAAEASEMGDASAKSGEASDANAAPGTEGESSAGSKDADAKKTSEARQAARDTPSEESDGAEEHTDVAATAPSSSGSPQADAPADEMDDASKPPGEFADASPFSGEATRRVDLEEEDILAAEDDNLRSEPYLNMIDSDGVLAKAIDEAVRYAQTHVDDFDPQSIAVQRELLRDAHQRQDIYGQFSMKYGNAAQELNRYLRKELARYNDVQWEGPHLPPEGTLDVSRLVPWVVSAYRDARLNRQLRENPIIPFHIGLLMDASGSMTEKTKSHNQQAAGFVLMDSLGGLPNFYLSILKAKDNARGMREVSRIENMKILARKRQRKNAILDFMKPDGSGNADIESLDWALDVEKAWRQHTKGKGVSFYFAVTDGQGNGWNPNSLRELHLRIAKLKAMGASLSGIGIGEHMDTTQVYGEHLKLSSVNELPLAILGVVKNRIARRLRV